VALDPKTRLGPYEIQELIGVGGMGEVYRGVDTRLNRSVAIKVVSPQLASQSLFRERFEREALTISRLNHPNVCMVFDVGHHEGVDFLVMEYVEGETLAERLSRGRLPSDESLRIALQIALGLAHAHAQGIVHRDIKPANVILTSGGGVKILDFGVAKWDQVGTATQPGLAMGTLAYMAPEQLLDDGVITPATDVWSVGVVLHEMLSGSRPFRGRDAVSILRSILHDPLPPLGAEIAVPTDLKRIVRLAAAKDPNERYATAVELAEELENCRAQISTALLLQASPRWRPSRTWIAAAAVLAALLGGFGARAVVQSRRAAWARGSAIPEIQRLVADDDYAGAFALLQQAAAYLDDDPSLAALWPAVSVSASIVTNPPEAEVSFKEYSDVDGDWQPLGQTPLAHIRLPRGAFRFRIEKEGFEAVHLSRFLSVTFEPSPIELRPLETGTGDMVHVPGEALPVNLSGFNTEELVPLQPFAIDRTEVTNQAFKGFVDAGGYRDGKYWQAGGFEGHRFVDATGGVGPANWELGAFPTGHAEEPVSGVSWYEAAAYCAFRGAQLPTVYHWARAALAPYEVTAPLGPSIVPLSNFSGQALAPVARFSGMGPYGTYDMAGNVREWVWNSATSGRRLVLGGAWHEPDYMFSVANSLPPGDRSLANGFRCMRLDPEAPVPGALLDPVDVSASDYRGARPVSEEIFNVFAEQLAYVPSMAGAEVEARETMASGAIRERVTIPVGYDDEQMRVYVYLPSTGAPPYQALIYFPALNAFQARASSAAFIPAEYVPRSGRALVVPVFKGSFERWDPALGLAGEEFRRAARLRLVQWRQDLGRTLDYLMTRTDIDAKRIGYYGRSFGASMPLPLLALEPRLRLAVLYSGGFTYRMLPPESNAVNYVSRVKIPVLMLNGRHDYVLPFETSQRPLFDLFGTPPAAKRHVVYDAGHDPLPRSQFVREILAWLDRHLGVVAGGQAG
jgi:formylglycine-generating enzyme required for sulfatase activity/dienelactone hydrolase